MKKIVFLHPDFGIGGAERLILDAAIALKTKKGHDVHIVTNQYSEKHCFTELKEEFGGGNGNGEKRIEIVAQDFPRAVFGRFHALCAYIRFCLAAIYICIFHRDAEVIISDQICAPLPILRLFTKASLLFYCHFPDQLLTPRNSFGKRLYRLVIDQIEAWTMCWAHRILVNSKFTEGVVRETFPALADHPLTVLHPSVNLDNISNLAEYSDDDLPPSSILSKFDYKDAPFFMSINRYERKKSIELAIHSFDHFLKYFASSKTGKSFLLIVGGYDPLNSENIDYYEELVALTRQLGLEERVEFLKSPSDRVKFHLLNSAKLLLYTPDREHFGIVPLEAMSLGTPVLAVDSGGPKETIVHGKTGFLQPADPKAFAQSMAAIVQDPKPGEMRQAAGAHVRANFSFQAFADRLDGIITEMQEENGQKKPMEEGEETVKKEL